MYTFNILIVFALFICCQTAFVDNLEKCSIKDDECLQRVNTAIIRHVGEGFPDLGIESIDPAIVKDVSVNVIDSVKVTLVEGVAKGIKDCEFKKFHVDLESKMGSITLVCNLVVKGKVTVSGSSPLIEALFGRSSITGEGNGKVKVDKLKLDFTFPYLIKRHDTGKLHYQWPGKHIKYSYEAEKMRFSGDHIYIGKEDITKFVVEYLNQNWKLAMEKFGDKFIDIAMDFYSDFAQKFFDGVPMEKFIIEDLSEYVTE